MYFHVVTPSFNQLHFLRRCVASVADQAGSLCEQRSAVFSLRTSATPRHVAGGYAEPQEDGGQPSSVFAQVLLPDTSPEATPSRRRMEVNPVKEAFTSQGGKKSEGGGLISGSESSIRVHHHIQDGGSTDGTVEWLAEYVAKQPSTSSYQLTFASETDEGMYDAINRGWLLAGDDVDVLAHMNCDEQYLPDGLEKVAAYFIKHPKADVVLADMIVVNNAGAYICHRRSLKPSAFLSRICCIGMTTTTFQRASVVRDRNVLFDTSWRDLGDKVWYNSLHKMGVRFAVYNHVVAAFADTGENMNLQPWAQKERQRYADEYLFGMRLITRLMSKFYSLRRYLKEFCLKPPTEYAIYGNDLTKRDIRKIEKPTGLWHRQGTSLRSSESKGVFECGSFTP